MRILAGLRIRRTIHVLYLTSSLSPMDGWGRYSRSLIARMKGLGVETTVLLTRDGSQDMPTDLVTYPVLSSSPNNYRKPLYALIDFLKVRMAIKQKGWNIVHCLTENLIPAAALIAGKKSLFIHAIGSYAVYPLTLAHLRPLYVRVYLRATKVLCASQFTYQLLPHQVQLKNAEVLPLGVDFNNFHGTSEALKPSVNSSLVLSVGAIKHRKGLHISIRAMAQIIQKYPEVRYEIIGPIVNRGLYEELCAFICDRGLEEKIRFLGPVDEAVLLKKYRECTLFVLTPVNQGFFFEGFGLVFLEANACGKPVVASRGCGAEEPVIHNYNGLLVPQSDAEATAEAIEYLLQNPQIANKMGKNGITRARMLDWNNIAKTILELYRAAL